MGGTLTRWVESFVLELLTSFGHTRDLYRADVQKILDLGCEVCSDVEMVVGGTSTTHCQIRLRADAVFCTDCYTYYILHKDLREDIKST